MMFGKRLRIGDVVEIRATYGFCYMQLSHKHPRWGTLVRALPGIFPTRPENLAELVSGEQQFLAFFPVQAALSQRLVDFVGSFPVPEHAQAFPLFRAPVHDLCTSKITGWWLWDGEKEWPVGELRAEQKRLPLREGISCPVLIERIERGWTPEDEA